MDKFHGCPPLKISCTFGAVPALAFAADLLQNQVQKDSESTYSKNGAKQKICFAPESAGKPTNCSAATLLPQF
jgi:hypothetical protein